MKCLHCNKELSDDPLSDIRSGHAQWCSELKRMEAYMGSLPTQDPSTNTPETQREQS